MRIVKELLIIETEGAEPFWPFRIFGVDTGEHFDTCDVDVGTDGVADVIGVSEAFWHAGDGVLLILIGEHLTTLGECGVFVVEGVDLG